MTESISDAVSHLETLLQDLDHYSQDASLNAVTSIVSRIMADIKFIRDEYDMRIIAEHVLDFPAFQDLSECLGCISRHPESENRDLLYIQLSILFHFGLSTPNVFRRLVRDDWIPVLKDILLLPDLGTVSFYTDTIVIANQAANLFSIDVKVSHVTVLLFDHLCQVHEMSLHELDIIDTQLLNYLCELVESSRNDNESFNYAVIRLLANTPELQLSITILLIGIFQYTPTRNLFYTNDLTVILDVGIREIQRVHDQNEELLHAFVKLLPLVVVSGASSASHKQVVNVLNKLNESAFTKLPTKRLIQRVVAELSLYDGHDP
ncbi:hypothetical protein BDEG_22541 [Batrachochytrium dendrobatidis JEL423]|uniref:SPIN90/Ldb17 leucine-rich domain-containing protein n=1 Tax=Batrachochytrium dendrobatidis (strain JEL423) TaxID=403673 RepID=A0A177WGZ2_BATDL|nr:hypothetical protein BDEG_22541 [Batrachochytrium dendrobatidis JEL423]